MNKILYRFLKENDPFYKFIIDNFPGNVYQVHELEDGKYFVVLIIEPQEANKLSMASIKMFAYFFNKAKNYSKIPICTNYAKRILFFSKGGEKITDENKIKQLFRETWIQEFLYMKPFKEVNNFRVELARDMYRINKSRLESIEYPKPKDELEARVFKISHILDVSNFEISKALYLFLQDARVCYELSHEISHNPTMEKINQLEEKFRNIPSRINKIKEIVSKREKNWLDWSLVLNEYLKRKNKYKRLILETLLNLIPGSFLLPFLSEVFSEIKDNIMGHKALQNGLKKYNELINFADQYSKDLFEIKFPEEKFLS